MIENMQKVLTATVKDFLLLVRDSAGLLVLFLMPAILVIVITLVQENILELSGQRQTEILLLDRDQGAFTVSLCSYLQEGRVHIKKFAADQEDTFRQLINRGRYQAGLIVPSGASARIGQEMRNQLIGGVLPQLVPGTVSLQVLFDPAAMAGFRAGLVARVQMAAKAAEMEMMAGQLEKFLARTMGPHELKDQAGVVVKDTLKKTFGHAFTRVVEQSSSPTSIEDIMNPVNQNVPAWALFGMFFTAIPIAGTILAERSAGISRRISGMPVSQLQLLCGKVIAYLGVCLCQFLLIACIGMYLFPQLGLPRFTLPEYPLMLLPVVVAASLAACGFGVLLGSLCRSYEQASTLGSTLVVIAAALGGVMVPVYAMPHLMQKLSNISPLSWGVDAFLDLLVRGRGFSAIVPDLASLLLFSVVMLLLSWRRIPK
jgi:ABC-2 type transport system permease protein